MEVAEFSTDYCGSAVKFCPTDERVLLVATADELIGASGLIRKKIFNRGCLYLLSHNPTINKIRSFDTTFPLLDCSWSHNATLAATAGAYGNVSIYNTTIDNGLIGTFKAHPHDVRSIDWNPSEDHLLTASIDRSIKVWDVNDNEAQLLCIYRFPKVPADNTFHDAHWNPVNHQLFATVSNYHAHMARVFDLQKPGRTLDSAIFNFPHPEPVVSCGWSHDHILGTTSLDKRVRLWDTRMIKNNRLMASYDLVGSSERSRVRFAPGHKSSFVTCSKTGVFIWDHQQQPAHVGTFNQDDDFFDAVEVGVDVSTSGLLTTVRLDGKVYVWRRHDWPLPLEQSLSQKLKMALD